MKTNANAPAAVVAPVVNDIIRNSWGYDQTNVDWYQVVKVSAKSVWLRRIAGRKQITGNDCGNSFPEPDNFIGEEVIMKRIRYYEGKPSLSMDFGVGRLYEGEPAYFSTYA